MAGKVVRKGMGGKNADPRVGTERNRIPGQSKAKTDHKLDTTPFAGKRIQPTTKG
jgi:hypothetical protein